ncbi:MAG: hypothetical protein E3J35_07635 [Methanomassiliicoccales archaeon]|nr:MAG: hypothetical protein E3J35_07635 [Methanomassiliicoccales archaeon]
MSENVVSFKMEKMVVPAFVALSIVALSIAMMTIASELSHDFKEWLAFPGHHWVGKGILAVVIFLVTFAVVLFLSRIKEVTSNVWLLTLVSLAVVGLSFVAIWIFYVLHFFEG